MTEDMKCKTKDIKSALRVSIRDIKRNIELYNCLPSNHISLMRGNPVSMELGAKQINLIKTIGGAYRDEYLTHKTLQNIPITRARVVSRVSPKYRP